MLRTSPPLRAIPLRTLAPLLGACLALAGCATRAAVTDTVHVRVDASAPRGQLAAIAPGLRSSCVLDDAGAVWCWEHQRGLSDIDDPGTGSAEPSQVALPFAAVRVVAGRATACALGGGGELACWGRDVPVGLQREDTPPSSPMRMPFGPVVDVRFVHQLGIALLADGSVRMWRRRGEVEPSMELPPIGMLAIGGASVLGMTRDHQIVSLGELRRVQDVRLRAYDGPRPRRIGATRYVTWILTEDGALLSSRNGGPFEQASVPDVADIAIAAAVCARTTQGEVTCLRGDEWVRMPGEGVRRLDAGPQRVCGLSSRETLCWATSEANVVLDSAMALPWNEVGPVAYVPHAEPAVPTAVCGAPPAGRQVLEVASGSGHACALLDDGSVRCWGLSGSGQVGANGSVETRRPVEVPLESRQQHLFAGGGGTCTLDERGSLSCWGRVVDGGHTSSPTRIPLRGRVAMAALSEMHACALLENRQVWCWGQNGQGQLGDGATATRWRPVRVPLRNADHVAVADGASCAVSDGAVFCWGTDQAIRVPMRIASLVGRAVRVALAERSACALLEDGAVWCWGDGREGQLGPAGGDGSMTAVRVPVPPAIEIAGAGTQFCARSADGALSCWGASPAREPAPAAVRTIEWVGPATHHAVGGDSTCMVAQGSGGACCWGERMALGRAAVGPPGALPPGPVEW